MPPLAADAPSIDASSYIPKTHLLRPSMSKTGLYLQCAWPWGKQVLGDTSAEAEYGTDFHAVMADLLMGLQIDPENMSATAEHAWSVYKNTLFLWLKGANPWGVDWWSCESLVEISVTYNMISGRVRKILPPNDDHVYEQARPDELPGTGDLIIFHRRTGSLLVLDHKTGHDVPSPLDMPQLLSLALAFRRLVPRGTIKRIIIAICHAPREGTAVIYPEEVSTLVLKKHADALDAARMREGNGSLTPGPECGYCPARLQCPINTNALAAISARPGMLTSTRIGAIHESLGRFDNLAEQLRPMMREWVRENGPGIRPDGQVVDLETSSRSNLSMASIRRAFTRAGKPEKADEVIRLLEANGCVEHTDVESLRARPERGR
jgi:hypothetical protein